MVNTTVRDIPEPLYAQIERSAAQNRRSINSEIIFLLEVGAKSVSHSTPDQRLELIRNARLSVNSNRVLI